MGRGVVWIVSDRGISLGDRLRPLPLGVKYPCIRVMRGRIARLGNDGALGPIHRAGDVALRIVAMEVNHPIDQTISEADHRRDKVGVDREGALEKTDGGILVCLGGHASIMLRPATQGKIDCVGVVGVLAHRAQSLGLDKLHAERIGEARDEVNLQFAKFAALAVETVGPDMRAGLGSRLAGR